MAAVTLLLASCLVLPISSAEASSYQISFDNNVGYLSTGEKAVIKVGVGADRPSGNYTYKANLSAGTVTPSAGIGSGNEFNLSVTAPSNTGDIVLTVTLSGANATVNSTAKYTIHVIKPTTISAQVKNNANVTMQNVPLTFKVDGVIVNTTTLTVGPSATKTVYFNWTAASLSNGEHIVSIELDPNNNFVNFIDGSKTFNAKFYVGDPGWGIANILLIIVFVLLVLVVFFSYMNKGKKKRKT